MKCGFQNKICASKSPTFFSRKPLAVIFRKTLKILNIILTSLFFARAFGQELPKRDGCIEIKKVNHHFFRNSNGDLTKRKRNKNNRPYELIYLDTLGNITEKAGYGKHHDADLRLLDYVLQYEYENSRLIKTTEYNTDYEKNITADYKTIYLYNNSNQLIQEKEVYYKTDSLFMQFEYEYDKNGNETKTIFNPTYYYQRTFDNQSNIQTFQQIHDGKVRWEWTYKYTDTTRIGEFKTFYNDGKDFTKKETRIYRNGKLTEVEEKYISKEGLSSKTFLHYDKLGLIVRIEFFEEYSNDMTYQLTSFTDIKVKNCRKLTLEIIERINKKIYDE